MNIYDMKVRAISDCVFAGGSFSEAVRLASGMCDSSEIADALSNICADPAHSLCGYTQCPQMNFSVADCKVLPDNFVFVPDDGDACIEAAAGAQLDADTAASIGTGKWFNPHAWDAYVAKCDLD